MSKRNSRFLKVILNILAWILVLSAFGVTLQDILRFDWLPVISDLLVNFFTQ